LVAREAVFCFFRFADDRIAFAKWSRVVPDRDQLGQPHMLVDVVNVRDIIDVDDRSHLFRTLILFPERVVRGEHQVLPRHAQLFAEYEFCQTRTIRAAAFFA